MTKLIGISGSLRRGSFNTALLRAATEVIPQGSERPRMSDLVGDFQHIVSVQDGL